MLPFWKIVFLSVSLLIMGMVIVYYFGIWAGIAVSVAFRIGYKYGSIVESEKTAANIFKSL